MKKTLLAGLATGLFVLGSGMAEATLVVYDDTASASLNLATSHDSYSGRANFDLVLEHYQLSDNPTGWYEEGYMYAHSHYGSDGRVFDLRLWNSAEHLGLRSGQVTSVWNFSITESDADFTMFAVKEEGLGSYSWSLFDLASHQLVDFGSYPHDWSTTGTLLNGHSYQLFADISTGNSSDESVRLMFDVDTSVEFSSSVPEPATMLIFGTGLVGLIGSRIRKKKIVHS